MQQLAVIERREAVVTESLVVIISETVEQHESIKAYDTETVLLQLALLANIRLYDDGLDDKLFGHAKHKQGDRQRIMRQALRLAIDEGRVVYIRQDALHVIAAIAEKKPLRPLFEDDMCLLDDNMRAKLREWGEPVAQFI